MENKDLWFGEIPSHWTYDKIGLLFSERRTKVSDKDYAPLSVARIGVVPQLATAVKTDAGDNRKLVCKGDFVINSRSDRKGSCGVADRDGSVSLINIVLTPRNEWNNRYVHYLMRSQPFSEEYYRYGRGIVADLWTTRYSEMKSILLPLPPRTEQDQIVRFLDWKVSAINRLIGINEKRRSMIQELVAKKFDDISSKATNYVKLKYISSLVNDFIEIEKNKYYIKTGMYNRGRGIFHREPIPGDDMGDSIFQRVHANCVMISGQFAWEAAVYITTREDEIGVASHRYYLLDIGENLPPEYVWCFLMSDYGQLQMKMCSHGAAGRNRPLNINELLNAYIPLPNANNDVVDLVNIVHKLMTLRENIDKSNQTLEELKTRLIADTVTGRIDVRNIEIPEYEFVGEESQAEKEIDADGIENEK